MLEDRWSSGLYGSHKEACLKRAYLDPGIILIFIAEQEGAETMPCFVTEIVY